MSKAYESGHRLRNSQNHGDRTVLTGKSVRETKPGGAHVPNGWGSSRNIQTLVLMAVSVLGIYLCYRMVLPFLPAIIWALALAILFTPLQKRLESRRMHPSLAAAVSVSAALLIVAVPVTFVGKELIRQAANGAELFNDKVQSGEWQRAIDAQPRIASIANLIERHIDLPGTVKTFASWLTAAAGSIVKGSVVQMIGFCITFYLLFFFLRDRVAALQAIRSMSPLSADETDRLFSRIADTVYAIVYGTVAVAALQGLLGGLMFWWLGLPLPLFWGIVMAMLAVVPGLGVFVVWIPAAIFLLWEGNWVKALILSLWGGLIVGNIDNLLRPILVGNRLKLHTVLVFMSVVGGLLLYGPAGLIIGPVTLSVIMTLLESWRNRTNTETTQP